MKTVGSNRYLNVLPSSEELGTSPLDNLETEFDWVRAFKVLINGYTGAVVNLRRSSDNAQNDFTATELTNGDAVAWVGGGNTGYVSAVYDQTRKGRVEYQTNASYQDVLIEGGVVLTDSEGNIAARRRNAMQSNKTTSCLNGGSGAVFLVADINNIVSSQAWLYTFSGNPAVGAFNATPSSTASATTNSGTPDYYVNNVQITNQRGPLGAALIGQGVTISAIIKPDLSNTQWRNSDGAGQLLYCDTDSYYAASIGISLVVTNELSTIQAVLNTEYSAY